MDLTGASALVTGGASGLGLATARRLAAAGAAVTIVDLPTSAGADIATELGGAFAPADVTDPEQVAAAVETASAAGPLRVVVNCAGIAPPAKVLDRDGNPSPLAAFEKIIRVNLIGTYNVIGQASAVMARTEPTDDGERGVIVNTASVAAFDGQIGQPAYSASKGGVHAMTLPIARELARYGIRVLTIAPGHHGDPDAHGAAAGRAGLARRPGPLPAAPRPPRRIRAPRDGDRRQRLPERRDDPPRRRHPDGTEMTRTTASDPEQQEQP